MWGRFCEEGGVLAWIVSAQILNVADLDLIPIMNPKELLECAPRLSESNRAYVILDNGGRGIIVPPGGPGRKSPFGHATLTAFKAAQSRRYHPRSFA